MSTDDLRRADAEAAWQRFRDGTSSFFDDSPAAVHDPACRVCELELPF